MSEKLREALRELIACYEEASDNMSKAERTHHRKVLASARAALSEEAPAADAQDTVLSLLDGLRACAENGEWLGFDEGLSKLNAMMPASRPLPALEAQAGRQDAASASEQRDAARYRWLRDRACPFDVWTDDPDGFIAADSDLDAACDRAMSGGKT